MQPKQSRSNWLQAEQIKSEEFFLDPNNSPKETNISAQLFTHLTEQSQPKQQPKQISDRLIPISSDESRYEEAKKSLERQFQFKLSKERESCELLILKLNQEIDMLKNDVQTLTKENQQLKAHQQSLEEEHTQSKPNKNMFLEGAQKNQKHFQKLFEELEKEHQMCIMNRKEQLNTEETIRLRLKILEEENDGLENKLKQYGKKGSNSEDFSQKVKHYEAQISNLKDENVKKQKTFRRELDELEKAVSKTARTEKKQSQQTKIPIQCGCENQQTPHDTSLFSQKLYELQIQRSKNKALQQIVPNNLEQDYIGPQNLMPEPRNTKPDRFYPSQVIREDFIVDCLEKSSRNHSPVKILQSDQQLIRQMYKKNTKIFSQGIRKLDSKSSLSFINQSYKHSDIQGVEFSPRGTKRSKGYTQIMKPEAGTLDTKRFKYL